MYLMYLKIYLLLINAAGLAFMFWDKHCARQKLWRVPERVLMGIAALGGSAGILAGMYLFRHKTRHKKFSVGIPLLLFIQAVLILFLTRRGII